MDEVAETKEPFVVDDDVKANWAMKKWREVELKKQVARDVAQAQIDEANEWLQEETRKLTRDQEYFTNALTSYAAHEREANGRKSISLPCGKILTRQTPDKWTVDADVFLKWAHETQRENLIRTKEEPDIKAIKAEFTSDDGAAINPSDGEQVPGVRVEPGTVSIKIEI